MLNFEADWTSLSRYQCPSWFRDAKFGIWAHWGPQGVPMQGDWYARHMYVQGHPQYEYHLKHFGHPSAVGYKDILNLWTCENFEPDDLMARFKKAGARYFTVGAVHHDNFDCWDSKHHRWNSVNFGPRKDIVGLWRKAARNHHMRFGVTEHLERSYSWFNTNKLSDRTGPLAGVPYDGNDPANSDFYFPPHEDMNPQYPVSPPDWWRRQWSERIIDLIERYDPDLLYTDGAIPFGDVGRAVVAHFYNRNMQRRGGELEAVYNLKSYEDADELIAEIQVKMDSTNAGRRMGGHGEYREGVGIVDLEGGSIGEITAYPWQCDICIGRWYYDEAVEYRQPELIVHMLADIVSKNGNLLLNFPGRIDGTLDDRELSILEALGAWFAVNGEAIHGTRPWKRYGQGKDFPQGDFAIPRECSPLGFGDYRFTTNGGTLYAIAMGWPHPGENWAIQDLGDRMVKRVELLGHQEPLAFQLVENSVQIVPPLPIPKNGLAYVLKLT